LDEAADDWSYACLVDDDVECRVRVKGEEREHVIRFADLWRLPAEGVAIEDVAPPFECLLWEAVALEKRFDVGPNGEELSKMYLATARDNTRGLSRLIYSTVPALGGGTRGERLTREMQATRIPGAAGRMRAAERRLSREERRQLTAAAVCEHLRGTGAWEDGGVAPVQLAVFELTIRDRQIKLLAEIGLTDPATPSKRRSRLFEAVLGEFEREAFGGRPHPDRSFLPLDEEHHKGAVEFTDEVDTRLELADLIARADLSPRESEVLELRRAGLEEKEIGAKLGIKPGTVKALLSRAGEKLRAQTRSL
jgi:DNA-binding CsgD family transcriptional regulator